MSTSIRFTALDARQILDSRGYPTVEVRGVLADGTRLSAATPAGASTGKHEAVELRDGGTAFSGRGVQKALAGFADEVAPMILDHEWESLNSVDRALADLDGTAGYRRLGANIVVAVSVLASRAFAHENDNQPLHSWIAERALAAELLPVPHFNVLNGGAHAANDLDFQEFMIAPLSAGSEYEAIRTGAEIYHELKARISRRFGGAGLGDEGGFAPQIGDPRIALDLLLEAIESAGYVAGVDRVAIALDPAANSFYLGDGLYRVNGKEISRDQLVEYYLELVDTYPIWSIEDGFSEDDHEGWQAMYQACSTRVQLVGDDLYVTDPQRIQAGGATHLSNAALIKPNQIGTVSQTLEAIRVAREAGMACMVSHRSGETADTFIADLVVGTGVGQIKSGAPARGERVAKYNRLAEIALDCPELEYGLTAQRPQR